MRHPAAAATRPSERTPPARAPATIPIPCCRLQAATPLQPAEIGPSSASCAPSSGPNGCWRRSPANPNAVEPATLAQQSLQPMDGTAPVAPRAEPRPPPREACPRRSTAWVSEGSGIGGSGQAPERRRSLWCKPQSGLSSASTRRAMAHSTMLQLPLARALEQEDVVVVEVGANRAAMWREAHHHVVRPPPTHHVCTTVSRSEPLCIVQHPNLGFWHV